MNRQEAAEFWQKHIEAFQGSGVSQQTYCLEKGLRIQTFRYRLGRKRKSESESTKEHGKQSRWLPLAIMDESCGVRPGGVRIRIGRVTVEADPGFDAPHLSDVLRAVGAVC